MANSPTFSDLYQLKSSDVEEPIDIYFHRPLAALIGTAGFRLHLPLTPNRMTLASLLSGWIGSAFIYFTAREPDAIYHFGANYPRLGWVIGAVFVFLSVIFDCSDGQIARYQGGGTRLGRILDGCVDALVSIPLWVILGIWVWHQFNHFWFWFTVFVGFNQWFQIGIYDRIKTVYMGRTRPDSTNGNESREEIEADYKKAMESGSFTEKVAMFIYAKFVLPAQDIATTAGSEGISQVNDIEAFRKKFRAKMRLASLLGLGTHMFLLYLTIVIISLWPPIFIVCMFLFLTIFNIFLIIGIILTKQMIKYEG